MRLQSKLMVICLTLVLLVALGGLINTRTQQRVMDDFHRLVDADMSGLLALGHVKSASLRMLDEAISYAFLQLKAEEVSSEADNTAQIEEDSQEEKREFFEARKNLQK